MWCGGRLATVRAYIDKVTPDELERPVKAHAETVGGALDVLFGETTAHTRFINRDLDIIEGSRSSQRRSAAPRRRSWSS